MRRLFQRDVTGPERDLAFQRRGAEVSRLEGFSDAVFGFGITLLVISGRAPETSAELLAMSHAVLPFIASFVVLFLVWRAQFVFFRRYALEDGPTIRLTAVLLMLVLLAIYPVKFLFTFVLDVLPRALLAGNESMKAVMPMENLPRVMLLYAIGLTGVAFVMSRLYRHAATQHAVIGLSELELFDTRAVARRWLGIAINGAILTGWCVAMLSLGEHAARRDNVWGAGYALLVVSLAVSNVVQRSVRRRLARARLTLVGEAPGGVRTHQSAIPVTL